MKTLFIITLAVLFQVDLLSAQTSLKEGGDLNAAAGWSGGLPGPGLEGVVAVDGFNSQTVFGFNGTTINHSDGTITSSDGFNFIRGDVWNMTGGRILARYVLSNGQNSVLTTINISGGRVELTDVPGNQLMGAANGGTWNVSGSAVLDATHATVELQTNGTVNIAADWTGEWIYGLHTGSEWQDLFLAGLVTFDNRVLDLAEFEATFEVSPDGATLSPRGGGAPVITTFDYNPDGTITLTWESRPRATGYTLRFSSDLEDAIATWADENDSIESGGESTTYTTSATFLEAKMFFVVVENQ